MASARSPTWGSRNTQLAVSSHEKVKLSPVPLDDDAEPAVLEGESEPSPLAPQLLSLPVTQVVHLEEALVGPDSSGQAQHSTILLSSLLVLV